MKNICYDNLLYNFLVTSINHIIRNLIDTSRIRSLVWETKVSLENGIKLAIEDFNKSTFDNKYNN